MKKEQEAFVAYWSDDDLVSHYIVASSADKLYEQLKSNYLNSEGDLEYFDETMNELSPLPWTDSTFEIGHSYKLCEGIWVEDLIIEKVMMVKV